MPRIIAPTHRDQAGAEHVLSRAAHDLAELRGADRDARDSRAGAAPRRRSRRRRPTRSGASTSRRPFVRASITSGRVEWFSSCAERSPSNSESPTTTPVESISVTRRPSAAPAASASESALTPRRHSIGDEPRLALELADASPLEAVAQPAAGDRDDAGHEHDDEHQRADEQPLGERHALRECPLFRR